MFILSKGFLRRWMSAILAVVFLVTVFGVPVVPAISANAEGLADYYVSPDGDDSNPGTLEAPFKTIEKARDTVRAMIADGMTSDITVMLRGGTYYLDSTVTFDERDSGRDGYKVIYKNYPEEEPVLNGGKRITNWELHEGNIYKADVGDGTIDIPEQLGDELLVNGGFEDGMAPWIVGKSGDQTGNIIELSTSEKKTGQNSLYYNEESTSGSILAYQNPDVDITKTYRYTFWAKYVDGTPGFVIAQRDAANTLLTYNAFPIAASSNEWRLYSGTIGPVGSGADIIWNVNTARIRFELRNYPLNGHYHPATGEAYYDDVSFKEVISKGGPVYEGMYFNTLYENGERSYKARYPNIRDDGLNDYNTVVGTGSNTQFQFTEGDIPQIGDISQLQAFIFPGNNWNGGIYNVTSVDYSQRTVTLSAPARQSIYYRSDSRYFVQGAIELLDSPGEFYLDKNTGTLYYRPRKTQIEGQVIEVPLLKRVIEVKGEDVQKPVENIVFEGLTIRNTDTTEVLNRTEVEGEGMEYGLPLGDYYGRIDRKPENAAVYMKNTKNIVFKNSKIFNVGVNALSMIGRAEGNTVEGNLIHDTGFRGILLQGALYTSQYLSKGNSITNNHIYDIGRIAVHDAAGIMLIDSGDNVISHNSIHRTARGAISILGLSPLGKTIDNILVTEENLSEFVHNQNNRIEFNDISDGTTETADAGPVYLWGIADGGIVINNNRVHHSDLQKYKGLAVGFGIYIDTSPEDVSVTNNIVDHLQMGEGELSLVMNPKKGARYINNFIIENQNTMNGVFSDFESEIVKRNIVYNSGKTIYTGSGDPKMSEADYNLFYNDNGEYRVSGFPGVNNIEEWKLLMDGKYDQHSITADPKFVDADNYDYRLSYDSPAYELGIEDVNIKDIGLTEDFLFADTGDPLEMVFAYTQESGNKSWMNISQGQQETLKVTGRTAAGYVADLSNAVMQYASDNTDVAEIDAQGIITAKAPGVARVTVTAQLNGITKTSVFDVLVDVDYAAKAEMVEQNSMDIKAVIEQRMGNFYKPGISTVTYSSDNSSIVSVDEEGIAVGHTVGTANVLAVVTTEGIVKNANIKISVLRNVLDKVMLSTDVKPIVGSTVQLQVNGIMLGGQPADLTSAVISYRSSDADIAIVDENGMVKTLKHGHAVVSADVTLDGVIKTGTMEIMNRSAFEQTDATEYDAIAYPLKDGGIYIWNTSSGGYVRYNDIDFGYGALEFIIHIAVNDRWAGGRVEIRLDAPDGQLIGTMVVQSTGDWSRYQEQSIPVSEIDGIHDLYLVFPDKEGGSSGNFDWFKFTPVPDDLPPATAAEIAGQQGNEGWYTSDVTVTFTAQDDVSGIARTEYSMDGGETWEIYSQPIVLTADGAYNIKYRSIDKAGNIEEIKTVAFAMDKSAPILSLTINGTPFEDGVVFGDYQPLSFAVEVEDNLSGVESASIVVDGEPYQPGTQMDFAGKLGEHSIAITAEDKAGNRTEISYTFEITTGIDSMQELLERYKASGDVKTPLFMQLNNDLKQAEFFMDKAEANLKMAVKHMEDFTKHLNNEAMSKFISEDAKAVLNTDADALIEAWTKE